MNSQEIISSGKFLCNTGILLFSAKDMIQLFKTFAPEIFILVEKSVNLASKNFDFLFLDPDTWSKLENISFDCAIMEKVSNLVAAPLEVKCSDFDTWNDVWSASPKDSNGNALLGNSLAIDCVDTLLRSESSNQHILGLGLENIFAIAMPDAVLVAHKDKTAKMKTIVENLNLQNIPQAVMYPKDIRPWGWFESLAKEEQFQIKRIEVNPGAALSLQSHKFRSEHWIVVEGTAKVTIGDEVSLLKKGESKYIPLGSKHRLENTSEIKVVLIEIQIGVYLGEDDIIRYEDIYDRN